MVQSRNKKTNDKKKFKTESLIWALVLLAIIPIRIYFDIGFPSFNYVLGLGIILLLFDSFNIKIPYISDKRKLPTRFMYLIGIIGFVVYLSLLIYFDK